MSVWDFPVLGLYGRHRKQKKKKKKILGRESNMCNKKAKIIYCQSKLGNNNDYYNTEQLLNTC